MLAKIADLLAEIPEVGGMSSRLGEYAVSSDQKPDIIIKEEKYDVARWGSLSYENAVYMESGWIFYTKLLLFGGMMLHSSAVMLDGEAYLFAGPPGMGKSTHTGLWMDTLDGAKVFNDDKPALRKIDGVWYAYGTPWCGKDGININIKAPIKGICFLKRGEENVIRPLLGIEAFSAVISQTYASFSKGEALSVLTKIIEGVVRDIPIYELRCKAEPEAVMLSYKTMSTGGAR